MKLGNKDTDMRKRNTIFGLIATGIAVACFFAGALFASPSSPAAGSASPQAQAPATEIRGPATSSGSSDTRQEQRPAVSLSPLEMQQSFREVAQKVLPVVVEVNVVEVVKQTVPTFQSPFDFFFGPQQGQNQEREFQRPGLGSGVIVQRQGDKVYVLTNHHVAGTASQITVKLYDQREVPAEIVGSDERMDLALIAFKTTEDVPVAVLGDSDSLYVGDWVLAFGNPYGFESTVTAGIVSALGRKPDPGVSVARFTDYIQTDAAINPGNSGGPLVNLYGEVVGINTWIASQTGGNVGIGFAIPVNNARKAISDFISTGKITYGWLGVVIDDPGAYESGFSAELSITGRKGALVRSFYKESPAEKGGILPGDLIVAVDGAPITSSDQLSQVIGTLPPGKEVLFRIVRYGKEMELRIKLSERQSEEKLQQPGDLWPGFSVVPITDAIRKELKLPATLKGVVLVGITSESPPAIAGLKAGDVVIEIGDTATDSLLAFYKALNQSGRKVMFTVYRQGARIIVGMVK